MFLKGGSTAQITTTKFEGTVAGDEGGAIYMNASSTATVVHSTFLETMAYTNGAALALESSSVIYVNDSLFFDLLSWGFGGALAAGASSAAMVNCTFRSTTAYGGGGAAYLWHSHLEIEHSQFYGIRSFDSGGALFIDTSSAVSVTETPFEGCSASFDGGEL